MKKIIAIAIVFTFLNVSFAEAIVKAGASCSKINATSTVSGYKYTCIKSGKKLVWSKGVAVKKPTPAPTATTTPSPSATPTPSVTTIKKLTYTAPSQLSDNIESCKIKETNLNGPRSGKAWNAEEAPIFSLPSGFPAVSPLTQRTGTVKWALIPIDFPDLPGEKNFRARVDDQMQLLSEWYSTVSEGNFKVEWVVADKWMTLPGKTSDYAISNSSNLNKAPNGPKLFNDAMSSADPYFDFTNIKTVNFLLPDGQTFIGESSQGFPWDKAVFEYSSKEGPISSYTIAGAIFFKPDREVWSYWAHEFGHAISIPHIGASMIQSPFQSLDIMGNESDSTKELSGWLRFLGGWMPNEKIFCQEISKVTKTEITLVPLSSQENGIKMSIFPLAENKAVIVESRRATKFSCKNSASSDGVLVYVYDANLSHGEEFLKAIYPNGRSAVRSSCSNLPYLDFLLHESEKVTVEGITVEVVAHGNYDKIIVSKR